MINASIKPAKLTVGTFLFCSQGTKFASFCSISKKNSASWLWRLCFLGNDTTFGRIPLTSVSFTGWKIAQTNKLQTQHTTNEGITRRMSVPTSDPWKFEAGRKQRNSMHPVPCESQPWDVMTRSTNYCFPPCKFVESSRTFIAFLQQRRKSFEPAAKLPLKKNPKIFCAPHRTTPSKTSNIRIPRSGLQKCTPAVFHPSSQH